MGMERAWAYDPAMGAVAFESMPEDDQPAWGVVLDEDRGSLPYALIHGEALVACAAWGLGESGVTPLDIGTPWAAVVEGGEPVVFHDSLCPMTPPEFIAGCVRHAVAADLVVVGVRPVTDTVKEVSDGLVGATVDREALAGLASPVVLPPSVVRTLDDWPGQDLVALVEGLRDAGHEVDLVEAPAAARRVAGEDDIRLLEALTEER